jgi:hypothetical protein
MVTIFRVRIDGNGDGETMTVFDKSLTYQFGVLWVPPTATEPLKLDPRVLATALNAPVNDVASLGLKLRDQLETLAGAVPQTFSLATSGSWRVMIQAGRIDAVFDARGYADTRDEKEIGIEVAARRIATNLVSASSKLNRKINRVALVLTGEASMATVPDPAQVVADRFFNVETQDRARKKRLLEASARVNEIVSLSLDNTPIDVNRIESGHANWSILEDTVDQSMLWQFDTNTSPKFKGVLSEEAVVSFLISGAQWISTSLQDMEGRWSKRTSR